MAGMLLLGLLGSCGPREEAQRDGQLAFAYGGERGPSTWGSLEPAYRECSRGRAQSPIDLNKARRAPLPAIGVHYRPADLEVENTGHSLEARYSPGSSITIGGKSYPLKQFHFHAPSEHRVGGRSSPLEFHLVHQAADGGTAVVAVFAREGRPSKALSNLSRAVPRAVGKRVLVEGRTDARHLLPDAPASRPRWSYPGSLTTPPCTEGVRWEVFTEAIEMSKSQIARYTAVYNDNNRPVQPLHGRRPALGGDIPTARRAR